MNRLIAALALALVALFSSLSVPAQAQTEMSPGEHRNGGLGFHNVEAPLGIRWWFAGQKVGLDAGFGFLSVPASAYPDEKLLRWSIGVGVPIVATSWHHVHVMFRPGILYTSQEVTSTSPPAAFDTNNATTLDVNAEIEAEAFLADNFSVSAAHGIGYRSFNPAGPGDSQTSFGSLGNNFTNIGFHVYFFGGSQ